MRILIYGINYAPELTGIGKYTGEMASWFVQQGHTVHVVTGMPYYPKWRKKTSYKGKWWHKEIIDGVYIYRCPLYVPKRVTSIKRIVHEFSFIISTFPIWLKKLFDKKYDVILNVSPPFHLGFLPVLYAAIRRSPVITHIQDLQIDVAKDLGMIKNKLFLRMMFAAEKFVLMRSKVVTTISKGMQKKILAKGIAPSKCKILPNWVDEEMIRPLSKEESLRDEFGLKQSDKIVLYSGNLGEKQGLQDIISAAKVLSYVPDVHFVIVGSGGIKKKLQESVKNSNLTNVRFFSLQSYDKMSELLAIADVHLVLQKRSASDLVMPSKLTTILAAGGVPLVTACSGTSLYEVISKNKIGFLVEPESVQALIHGIKVALRSDLKTIAMNARLYAEQHLSRDIIMQDWNRELGRILKNRSEDEGNNQTKKSEEQLTHPISISNSENLVNVV